MMRIGARAAIILVVIALGVAVATTAAWGRGRTSLAVWNPESVTITVAPGESETAIVSLMALKTLGKLTIRSSGDLRGLVNIEPSFIEKLQVGETIQVAITASPEVASSLGTIEGKIQFWQQRRWSSWQRWMAISEPLSVTLNVWEKAEISTSGFNIEVGIPPDLVASRGARKILLAPNAITDSDEPGVIEIASLPMDMSTAVEFVRGLFQPGVAEEIFSIQGVTGRRLSGVLDDGLVGWGGFPRVYILVPVGLTVLEISYNNEDAAAVEALLQTLSLP